MRMKTIKFFRSKFFALTLALMASVSSFAYDEMTDFQVDGLYYNFLEEENVEVTHPYIPVVPVENVASNTKKKSHAISADDYYNLTNLVIPSTVTYEGKVYNVTRIGFDAFNQCDKLTFVDIPSSVKTIGVGAFNFCSSLTSITLKEGLEHIEWNAFEDCRSLENITFPNSLKTIGNYAFSYTLWYKNHPNGAVYAGNVFYKYKGDIPQNTSFVIKEGTVSISPYAFVKENYHEDYSLVSVSIPNSVEVIGEGAFYRCRALTSIVIPAGVTTIETLAFHYCKALKSVTCEAVNPPALSGSVFLSTPIADATLYVPAESLEAYKTATEWKDFGQILPITWSAECYEFRDFNLGIELFPRKSSLVYTLYHTDDRTIEPLYVDSVWILDPELDKQNPLHVHTLYAQPGDTIDLSFLEKNKHYILRVHINECQMSRVFLHRVVKWEYKWCNQWNVLWFDGMRFDESASTSHYQLGQDTVIGDYTYRKFTSRTSVRFTEDWKVYVYYEGFDDNDPYTEDLPTGEYLAYDFSAQVGDTLEVFSGIGTYSTYLCVVDDVQQTDIQTALRTITLHKICRMDTDGDGIEEDYDDREMTWIEGVGSPEGFLISDLPCGWVGGGTNHLLCAYKDDELIYTDSFYESFGCDYNAGVVSEELFPTLSGLQRTICREYCEQADNKTRIEQFTNLTTRTETGAPYIYCSPFLLREKDNKIMIYSRSLNKDLVLYDFNLQVGDSLPMLYIDTEAKDDWIADRDMDIWYVVDYHKDLEGNILPADTLIVTDVSMITLLDGKEYKKWTFNNGMEYVEGIGSFGNGQWSGDFFQLIANKDVPTCLLDEHLVCVSKNGQLLYQMDEAEMERLGAECLCQAEQNPKDLFPTLWGLQRTSCTKTIGENENGTVWGLRSYLMQEIETATIDGKQYIVFGDEYDRFALREENNKILVYSSILKKDLVLYDFTLEVGDSLPALYYELRAHDTMHQWLYNGDIVDYNKDDDGTILPAETFVVTDISTITLLDGKEYKKWTFDNGMEYVEGIGSFGTSYAWNDFYQLIANGPLYSDVFSQHLVCASKNGQLLYKMEDTEMERLDAECLCEIEPKWSETWCNQWNILSHGYLGPQDPLAGARTSIYWLSNNTVNRSGQEYIPLMCSSSMPNEESTHLVGELRFTEDKQVYFYYAFDETEYLLYDFGAELGDTLELFAGLEFYDYHKTYTHVITDKETLDDGRLQIQADVVIRIDNGAGEYFEDKHLVTWIEGLGSTYGIIFNPSNPGVGGDGAIIMLCAYRDDECVYTTNLSDYKNMGCVYNNDGTVDEDLFPMLAGLQRTVCNEFCGDTEDDNSANNTYKQTFDSIFFENDKPYILCNDYLLCEEDNKIFLYSQSLNKDIVLYDFTLEVGDSLPAYIKDFDGTMYSDDILVVTDISSVTLLDGKEYKKWTFDNGMEYVEGIGMYGGRRNGNFFGLIREVVVPCHTGTHLVCVSKNNKLLYQMDDAEMERLGAECLCDYDRGPLKDNAKNGKIGGRPTPTQWNMLEVDLREMEHGNTILRAETFSYTLENDSIVTNGKTFYQLARQSTKDTAITKSFVGAIHFSEDEGNRVYFLCDGEEYVLYDFTAEPGDILEIFAGINNYPQDSTYTHVVTGKDTLENGACRIILEVIFPEETNTTATNTEKVWLAGLGSIDGIVHNAAKRTTNTRSSDTQTTIMLCAWREDDCLYTTDHPDYDTYGCIYNQDHPTAVENTQLPMTDCQKFLRNGQLLIMHEGKTYNVMGMEL